MEVATALKILDIISKALPVLLVFSGIIAFLSREWIKKWIEAHFRRTVDAELENMKARLAESLEEKKAALSQDLARTTETLKAQLATTLERDKRALDEEFRRKARKFDQQAAYYEAFSIGYTTTIVELYALDGDYYDAIKQYPDLVAHARQLYLSRAHSLLMQAQQSLKDHEPYADSDLVNRIARLFRDLSSFMAEGARDKNRLDQLATEKSLIQARLKEEIFKEPV